MISVVILTKNSEQHIEDVIKSAKPLDGEILILDDGSTDNTVKIAKKLGARVEKQTGKGYGAKRNLGKKLAKGDWIFYLDSDELVSSELVKEIKRTVKTGEFSAYAFARKNIILGKWMKYGGWYPDYVERLFRKKDLTTWVGDLHERPVYNGSLGYLENPLTHLKHDNLEEMVEKTNKWSEVEAELLFDSKHPKMSWWRFWRVMFTEFMYRMVSLRGFQDRTEGFIYGMYQMWSKFLTYAKLWEMQKGK